MALQSVVVPMLVLINNEKKYSYSVDVLDQLEVWVREIHTKAGLCAPPVGEHVAPGSQIADPSRADEPAFHIPPIPQADEPLAKVKIPCFADQLTRVRLACAKNLRASSYTTQDRLDHLYPFRIVDWHTKRSFLKVKKREILGVEMLKCKNRQRRIKSVKRMISNRYSPLFHTGSTP